MSLDPDHTIEIKLARARGNGAGVRVEPHEVEKILEWKRKADAKAGTQVPLWNPSSPRERPKEMVP
jgi:Holliday junction resolvase